MHFAGRKTPDDSSTILVVKSGDSIKRHSSLRLFGWSGLLIGLLATGCSSSEPTAEIDVEPLGVSSCVLYVHGRSDAGAAARVDGDRGELSPNGNVRYGDGFGWRYASEVDYADARAVIANVIEDSACADVAVSGFSNGAAFVAKLYCRGETFDGRVVGFVIDDPVPDTAVADCDSDTSTEVALYWTGALDPDAQPGVECDALGWTCDGERLLGIEAYAAALGTQILGSPFEDHRWYREAPELDRWL